MAKSYEQRVTELEAQGLTRSDAQGVMDAEDLKEGKNMDNKREKFTPGPWKVIGKKYVESTVGQLVASLVVLKGSSLKKEDENAAIAESNAHLIAAAPDMYEALEWVLYHIEETHGLKGDELSPVKDALSKARGES